MYSYNYIYHESEEMMKTRKKRQKMYVILTNKFTPVAYMHERIHHNIA